VVGGAGLQAARPVPAHRGSPDDPITRPVPARRGSPDPLFFCHSHKDASPDGGVVR